jgi:hypothetical protein
MTKLSHNKYMTLLSACTHEEYEIRMAHCGECAYLSFELF